jgi:hypothetical protein
MYIYIRQEKKAENQRSEDFCHAPSADFHGPFLKLDAGQSFSIPGRNGAPHRPGTATRRIL